MRPDAEVLLLFDEPFQAPEGQRYHARVLGCRTAQGLWEGFIEFTPDDGGATLATDRETTQPNRTDLEYWATGLTRVYLEGALTRALDRAGSAVPRPAASTESPRDSA